MRWVAALAVILTACLSPASGAPFALTNGQSVEILSVGPLVSTHGWSALMLKYQTNTAMNDTEALRREVDDIWQRFIADAERGGYASAIISANEPPKGSVIIQNQSYNFVFEKREGTWRTPEIKERIAAKLDQNFVRAFINRIDWAIEHDESNAALLYMANDWTLRISGQPQLINRIDFLKANHAALSTSKNFSHQRQVLEISLDPSRTKAKVTSQETTTLTINGRNISAVERSTDTFELRNDVMVWTSSSSAIEKETSGL